MILPKQSNGKRTIEQDLEVLQILKKYCYNDGWAGGGYFIRFYDMKDGELKKIQKWFNGEEQ